MPEQYKIAILGASGYTGAELLRLMALHPSMEVAALAADRKAGMSVGSVFPHLRHLDLPLLARIDDIDLTEIDLVFSALPHKTGQEVVKKVVETTRVVDLSADFRLKDVREYERWYGVTHAAPSLVDEAAYGLTEYYRDHIRDARLVAGTGCNAATGLLAVLPLLEADVIDPDEVVIDLATGVSGAGRSPSEAILHAEVSEGFRPYSVAAHRHIAEFEQEFSKMAGKPVSPTFVAHLLPQNRGILATIHVKGDPAGIHSALANRYAGEPFVVVLPFGEIPDTHHVRGSNYCHIGVVPDRRDSRAIVISTLDNLVKGASGQALQNANLMLGIPETMGLAAPALFP